jgi:hypothetical protein
MHAGLSSLAASADQWTQTAAAAASLLAGQEGPAALQALATLAADRLAVLSTIDPESFGELHGHMDTLFGSLRDLMEHESTQRASGLANALVLGVQQLVATSQLEDLPGGVYSVDAMATAQKLMEEVMQEEVQVRVEKWERKGREGEGREGCTLEYSCLSTDLSDPPSRFCIPILAASQTEAEQRRGPERRARHDHGRAHHPGGLPAPEGLGAYCRRAEGGHAELRGLGAPEV